MIVTTAGRTDEKYIEKAKDIARKYNYNFKHRRKESIEALHQTYRQDILVVGKDRLEWYPNGMSEPVFFHPNSASFRLKRILKGERDPFLQATELEKNMAFLDCTLGLASDSIVASYKVGEKGTVIGLEGNHHLANITAEGLQSWKSNSEQLTNAMRRIQVKAFDHLSFLKDQERESFDVVYFDPMFSETIDESKGIKPLKQIALTNNITLEAITEALRVAKKRVVLKDHWRSKNFLTFNFKVDIRKSAKFHYGVLEK